MPEAGLQSVVRKVQPSEYRIFNFAVLFNKGQGHMDFPPSNCSAKTNLDRKCYLSNHSFELGRHPDKLVIFAYLIRFGYNYLQRAATLAHSQPLPVSIAATAVQLHHCCKPFDSHCCSYILYINAWKGNFGKSHLPFNSIIWAEPWRQSINETIT